MTHDVALAERNAGIGVPTPDGGSAGVLSFMPSGNEQVKNALQEWVGGMALSIQGAQYIVDTPNCPDSFWPAPLSDPYTRLPKLRGRDESPEEYEGRRRVALHTLAAVVRYGLHLGLPPEVAPQGIFIIGGRFAMYADLMASLVKMRGHKHRIAVRDGVLQRSRTFCTVEVRRSDEQEWQPFTFTIDDAIEMGYVPGKGPNEKPLPVGQNGRERKDNRGNAKYLTDPAAMLYARATTIACKAVFPDVLRGLHSVEELQDDRAAQMVEVTADVVEPQQQRRRATAILADPAPPAAPSAAPPAAPVPPAQPVPPEQPAPQPGPPERPVTAPAPGRPEGVTRATLPMTPAQTRRLNDLFGGLGIGNRSKEDKDARLKLAQYVVQRPDDQPLGSAADLTSDEVDALITELTENPGDVMFEVFGQILPGYQPPEPSEPGGSQQGQPPTVAEQLQRHASREDVERNLASWSGGDQSETQED